MLPATASRSRRLPRLLGGLTVLAVTAGGLAFGTPAAEAAPARHTLAAHAVAGHSAHRVAADASCRKATVTVGKARATVKRTPGRSARAVKARGALAKALVAQGTICLRTVSAKDLATMLPPDVAAQVTDLIAELKDRLATVTESIPGSNAAQLDKIISRLDALDADGVVAFLADLADQLDAAGDDPTAVATVLQTVFDGMGDNPGGDAGDDASDGSDDSTDAGDDASDDGSASTDDGTDDGTDDSTDPGDVGIGDGTDLSNSTELDSLATLLQQLTDYLTTTDLTDAWTQVRDEVKGLLGLLKDTTKQFIEANPDLQTLVDLFDQVGFDDLADDSDLPTLADGFAAILGGLFDHVGRDDDAIEHGIRGLMGDPGGALLTGLFGNPSDPTAGTGFVTGNGNPLSDFLDGLFGSAGGFADLFGGFLGDLFDGLGDGVSGGFSGGASGIGGLIGGHRG